MTLDRSDVVGSRHDVTTDEEAPPHGARSTPRAPDRRTFGARARTTPYRRGYRLARGGGPPQAPKPVGSEIAGGCAWRILRRRPYAGGIRLPAQRGRASYYRDARALKPYIHCGRGPPRARGVLRPTSGPRRRPGRRRRLSRGSGRGTRRALACCCLDATTTTGWRLCTTARARASFYLQRASAPRLVVRRIAVESLVPGAHNDPIERGGSPSETPGPAPIKTSRACARLTSSSSSSLCVLP
jgi:hypothetical protein